MVPEVTSDRWKRGKRQPGAVTAHKGPHRTVLHGTGWGQGSGLIHGRSRQGRWARHGTSWRAVGEAGRGWADGSGVPEVE